MRSRLPNRFVDEDTSLLIAGASTRSAACSARRAGLRPHCLDAFGDVDLASIAEVRLVSDYPQGLVDAANEFPDSPWMYTGALENQPQIVAALGERRHLWGNGPDEILAARDPWRIHKTLQRNGLPHLKVWGKESRSVGWERICQSGTAQCEPVGNALSGVPRTSLEATPNVARGTPLRAFPTAVQESQGIANRPGWADAPVGGTSVPPMPPIERGEWMLKPLRGSAGRGIVRWEPGAENHATLREPHYFQQFSDGLPISALFLGVPNSARLLGVTRQLIDLAVAHAPAQAWCGNIAPWSVTREEMATIEQVGRVIAESCQLKGLFGCDFLLEAGSPRLTEVNPRYTGSVELIECLLQRPLLDWHRRAGGLFASDSESDDVAAELDREIAAVVCHGAPVNALPPRFSGKIVLYADAEMVADDFTRFARHPVSFELADMADIPRAGERFSRGQPICTLFATAGTPEECLTRLEQRAVNCRIAVAAACL